jgi:hypothetical protein
VTLVSQEGGDLGYAQLGRDDLRRRLLDVCGLLAGKCDEESVAAVRNALAAWRPVAATKLDYAIGGHASVTPTWWRCVPSASPTLLRGRSAISCEEPLHTCGRLP